MKNGVQFEYSESVKRFVEERMAEDPSYDCVYEVFEFIVSRNREVGQPLLRAPEVIRRFPVLIPGSAPNLVFFYTLHGKVIRIKHAEYEEDTPLPGKYWKK